MFSRGVEGSSYIASPFFDAICQLALLTSSERLLGLNLIHGSVHEEQFSMLIEHMPRLRSIERVLIGNFLYLARLMKEVHSPLVVAKAPVAARSAVLPAHRGCFQGHYPTNEIS